MGSSSRRRSDATSTFTVKDGVEGHRRIRLGQALHRDDQGRAVSAGADVPRAGRAAVAIRRQQGRLPGARRRSCRGRDRPRAAEPVAAPRAADVRLLAAQHSTGGLEDQLVERFVTTRDYTARRRASRPTTASTSVSTSRTTCRPGAACSCCIVRAVTTRRRGARATGAESRRRRGRRQRIGRDRGHAPDPRHRPRLHRQARERRHPRRLRAIDPHRPAGCRRARRSRRQQRPTGARRNDRRNRPGTPGGAAQNAIRERRPQMIVVEKDDDMSFMPFRTNGRDLDLSRFDTGGVENADSAQQLSAYLFSDRGIYRPGETTHLGMITRTADWKSSLAGLPLEVEITDARGLVVSRRQLTVSAGSFDEIAYTSQPQRTDRHVRSGRLSRKRREAPRNARQHVVQRAGVRAGPHEGPARSRGRAERRLASAGRREGADDGRAPVRRAGEQPARRGRIEPDTGAAALHALSGLPLPGRRSDQGAVPRGSRPRSGRTTRAPRNSSST